MGGTAAMAPCVALAPRRDGMPSPGTSGGIGGRPHVALRQPLSRYARRPISPNRVRPGDLGGFSVVRSAPVGEGRPSEDDPLRRDEARGLLAAGAALVTLGLRLMRGLGFSCCQIHGTTVMRWCVIGLNIGGAADMGRDLRGDIIPFNPDKAARPVDPRPRRRQV